jgi:imidazoleglycerol-phosphate dehydratase
MARCSFSRSPRSSKAARPPAGTARPPTDTPLAPARLATTPLLREALPDPLRRQMPTFVEGTNIRGRTELDVRIEGDATLRRGDTVILPLLASASGALEVPIIPDLEVLLRMGLATGIGFLDHMLTLFAKHGLFDITVNANGDLHVDDHHTAEDVCICLGQALDSALADRRGIVRTAHSFVPMDESLGFVAVDLGGRPYAVFDAEFVTPRVGNLGTDLIFHLFESIAIHARMN